uniref:Uncharacterized protein n=1 Tax=viral metagenome TaxID=1070528 RepID=A0A6C0J0K2_9ZZZZ
MSYLSELVCDLVYLRDVLMRSDPDSPQWYSAAIMRRGLLEFYLAADPHFRHVMDKDPTSVICVFDI